MGTDINQGTEISGLREQGNWFNREGHGQPVENLEKRPEQAEGNKEIKYSDWKIRLKEGRNYTQMRRS